MSRLTFTQFLALFWVVLSMGIWGGPQGVCFKVPVCIVLDMDTKNLESSLSCQRQQNQSDSYCFMVSKDRNCEFLIIFHSLQNTEVSAYLCKYSHTKGVYSKVLQCEGRGANKDRPTCIGS